MFESIHVFLYDIRFGLLILLLPMFWSMWVFWVYFTTPGKISSGTDTYSRRRHSHRMRAQQKQSTATMAKEQSGIAVAEPDGNQSNLLDALAEEDEREVSEFQAASTIKQPAITPEDKEELVEQLVDNVADKVAAQIEALTGQAVHDDLSEAEAEIVDMQDMLETVQEDSSTDNQVLPDAEGETEGEHTAAIRKASKMEEIGFHRASEDEDSPHEEIQQLLDNPEVAGLAAKHVARISDLGLVDGPGDERERLRTAQLDDILDKLDNVLDIDATNETDSNTDARTEEKKESHSFSNASTQLLQPVTDSGMLESQATPEAEADDSQAVVDNDDAVAEKLDEQVDDEANSFFGNLSEEEASVDFDEQETIREESNLDESAETIPDGEETIDANAIEQTEEDSGTSFLREMSEISEGPDAEQTLDEFDQLETVKVETDRSDNASDNFADEPNEDKYDLLETIAVENDSAPAADPNSETASDENPIEALEQDETGTDSVDQPNKDEDDDLPAWARADSFDDDDDDGNGPKQQNLFD